MKHRTSVFIALLLLALPSVAQANMGTPLMWAGLLHLFVGNLFIGVMEGLLLSFIFKLPKLKAIGLLILANYVSAWVGSVLLHAVILPAIPIDLNNGWMIIRMMVVVTYVMTLALEFPFVALAFRRGAHRLRKSLFGSLIIQTISYAILVAWYGAASGISLFTGTEVVPLSSMSLPEEVIVYYISADDGDVYKRSLAGPDVQKVLDLNSTNPEDRLIERPSSADDKMWDLAARVVSGPAEKAEIITVQESIAPVAWPALHDTNTDPPQYEGTWMNFGDAPRLGAAQASPWEFKSGFWPIEGLRGTQRETGATVAIAFETPFGAWSVRNATHLPADKVLLQLGKDQICLYDPETRRIALVTKGRGQIAVIMDEESNQRMQPTDR